MAHTPPPWSAFAIATAHAQFALVLTDLAATSPGTPAFPAWARTYKRVSTRDIDAHECSLPGPTRTQTSVTEAELFPGTPDTRISGAGYAHAQGGPIAPDATVCAWNAALRAQVRQLQDIASQHT